MRSSLRVRLAVGLGRATSRAVRVVRRGGGSVIGARVTLALAPAALSELADGHKVAVVSGTNGKSTTTALLAAAARAGGISIVSNIEGSNLRSGIVHVLSQPSAATADLAVLEIDEMALASVMEDFDDPLVVLLNLSRDQLDRFGEVRTVAAAWRRALSGRQASVVANADDPLVVWGAGTAASVTWVAVGLRWRLDAAACPNCGAVITSDAESWACTACDLRQPADAYRLEGSTLVDPSGGAVAVLAPGVPGRHNLGNAAQALVAAQQLGVDASTAAAAMGAVTSVSGRYQTITAGRARARLLLAKNPAGWAELLGMIEGDSRPLVLAINARIADGRDPSWLWDVPFERLHGRSVVAAGERAADLAVRLHYADVPCEIWDGDILDRLPQFGDADVDVVANYTVFADLVRKIA